MSRSSASRLARICVTLAIPLILATMGFAAAAVIRGSFAPWTQVADAKTVSESHGVHNKELGVIVTSFLGEFIVLEDRFSYNGEEQPLRWCESSFWIESWTRYAKFDPAGRVKIGNRDLIEPPRAFAVQTRRGRIYAQLTEPFPNSYPDRPQLEQRGPFCL